jgi:hypothetical protein
MTKQTPQEEAAQIRQQIRKLVDDIRRSKGSFDPVAFAHAVMERGIGWEGVFSGLSYSLSREFGEVWVPPYISHFIVAYMNGRKVGRVLDPYARLGFLLIPIVRSCEVREAVGIVRAENEFEAARLISAQLPINWKRGEWQALIDQLGQFDLVVSSPPFGLPAVTEEIPADSGAVKLRDSMTNILVLRSCRLLQADGDAIFLLPNTFFRGDVVALLPKFSLSVNAVFALPKAALAPFTGIDLNLVLITRRPSREWFVGQLDPQRDPGPLLDNFRQRTIGPVPELGRIVTPDQFVSWQNLVTAEEIERLVQRGGLKPVPFAEIVESINLGERSEDGGFTELPNAVFLPLIGTSPAVTALSALRIKPQNCAQLVLRPDKAFAEFLAGFFNSSLGRKVRDQLLRGTFIPKIAKQSLMEARVYLPSIETQNQVVDVQREIRDLTLRLGELQQRLWNRPGEAPKVRKALASINVKQSLESWLEALPFPLASVLWRYQATTNVEHKNDHLLHFFEATAQFLGTLMASAFHSNAQFFEAHKRDWFDAGKENPHSLTRSNFGDWVVRCQRLAKTTRQMLSTPEERDLCLSLFKTRDSAKIEAISSKAAFFVLEKASRYRNDWKGHSGIVGAKEQTRRLTLLQEELTRLWEALGLAFEDWWLVRPGANEFSRNIYHFRAENLSGSRQIFRQIDIETTVVMDSDELYFFDATTRLPLQLLHFFRMMPSPETEEIACYFYNRLEKEAVRWVSYHFEGKAERLEPDPAILSLIQEVEENST